jgi:hypothetical protein
MSDSAASSELATWTPTLDELEQRVQRLEDVVAALSDTQALEDRVRARVIEQLRHEPIQLDARPVDNSNSDVLDSSSDAKDRSNFAVRISDPRLSPLSLATEIWWELRFFYRMLREPFYKLSWTCRIAFVLPVAFLLCHYLLPYFNWFFPLELALFLCLAYFVFKMFSRELRRYQAFLQQRRSS